MHYAEYAPRPGLADVVDCLWTLTADADPAGAADESVLPDGRSELVMHFGDPFAHVGLDGLRRQAAVAYAGQIGGPLLLRSTGRVAVLGVRFTPDGAASVVRPPQHELAGLILPVEAFDGTLAKALERACVAAVAPALAVGLVQDELERRVDRTRLDPRVRAVVARVLRRRGGIGIESMASSVGLARRHLERRFQDLVGLSPKRFARIRRFQHARSLLERLPSRQRGTLTAGFCGYADQAHFIREFGELAGCSPETYLRRTGALAGFFADDEA